MSSVSQSLLSANLFDEIPDELKALRQWVLHRPFKGKPKVPHQRNGKLAENDSPSTWCSFDEAIETFQGGGFDGIGFVFTADDGLVGIDIDFDKEKVTEAKALEIARPFIERFDSFTEVSQSKKGFHVIVKAAKLGEKARTAFSDDLPPGIKQIEIFEQRCFFALTGNILPGHFSIETREEELKVFRSQFGSDDEPRSVAKPQTRKPIDSTEFTLMCVALSHIDPDAYADWIEIILMFHFETSGTTYERAAIEAVDKWASKSKKWKAGEILAKWKSANPSAKNPMTRATLFHRAQKHGFNQGKVIFLQSKARKTNLPARVNEDEPQVVCLETWLQTPPKPIEHILENAFGPGDKVLVVGKAKTCKSFALGQMGLSLSAGKDFLSWKVPKARRVLCIQLEITGEWFKRRCAAMCQSLGIDDRRNFYLINGRGIQPTIDKFDSETKEEKPSPVGWIEWLLSSRELFTLKPEVIIIDPIYKVEAFDELSTVQVKQVLAGLDRLTAETGAAVVYCHHDRKGVAGDLDLVDRGSGSGVFGRDWDALFALSEHAYDPKVTVMHAAFRNFASPREPYAVEFHYPIFIPSDEAAIPRTTDHRNPTSAVDLGEFSDSALALLRDKPIAVSVFKSKLESELKLTQKRARAVYESLKTEGLVAVRNGQRRLRQPDMVGLPEQITLLEEEI